MKYESGVAIFGAVSTMATSLSLPVSWPNVDYTPGGVKYIQPNLLWATDLSGINSTFIERGILQIDVVIPDGQGVISQLQTIDAIRSYFYMSKTLKGTGFRVVFQDSQVSPALTGNGYNQISVSINFVVTF